MYDPPLHPFIFTVSDIATRAFKTDVTLEKFTVPINISNTRSRAITYGARCKQNNTIVDIFVKITPEFTKSSTRTKAEAEADIYEVTTEAVNRKLTPHFVKSYNKTLLRTRSVKLEYPVYFDKNSFTDSFTVLVTEHIVGRSITEIITSPKQDNVRLDVKFIQLVILLQIVHSLHIFNLLGIKHLDLHYGNILVVTHKPKVNGVIEYIIPSKTNEYSKEKIKFYLPDIGYSIKIIDFDGAVKFPRKQFAGVLKKVINNPDIKRNLELTNIQNTYIQNYYKFLKNPTGPISFINGNYGINGKFGHFTKQFMQYITNDKTKLINMNKTLAALGRNHPRYYYKNSITNLFRTYGQLVNTAGRNIVLSSNILKSPLHLLIHMNEFKQKHQSLYVVESYNSSLTSVLSFKSPTIVIKRKRASNSNIQPARRSKCSTRNLILPVNTPVAMNTSPIRRNLFN